MGKRKRERNVTVYGCIEGEVVETTFVDHLRKLYDPHNNGIKFYPESSCGGSPDRIVGSAIKKCDRDRSFAWLDEDFEPNQPLSLEIRETLANLWLVRDEEARQRLLRAPLRDLQREFNKNKRNPILIISQPLCVEAFILKVLQVKLPVDEYDHAQRKVQQAKLKSSFGGIREAMELFEFYSKFLGKDVLEKVRVTHPELDLLITMITV